MDTGPCSFCTGWPTCGDSHRPVLVLSASATTRAPTGSDKRADRYPRDRSRGKAFGELNDQGPSVRLPVSCKMLLRPRLKLSAIVVGPSPAKVQKSNVF